MRQNGYGGARRALLLLAVLPPLLAGCVTGGEPRARQPAPTPPATAPVTPATPATPAAAAPDGPVGLADPGGRAVLTQSETTGNRALALAPATAADHGRRLTLALNCRGAGFVRVAGAPGGVGFQAECEKDQVIGVQHQSATSAVRRGGTVSVQAPTGVRWSLVAAWTDPV
jgi:hypothetical protein